MRVEDVGLRVEGSGFRVQGPGFRVQDSEFRVDAGWRLILEGLVFEIGVEG